MDASDRKSREGSVPAAAILPLVTLLNVAVVTDEPSTSKTNGSGGSVDNTQFANSDNDNIDLQEVNFEDILREGVNSQSIFAEDNDHHGFRLDMPDLGNTETVVSSGAPKDISSGPSKGAGVKSSFRELFGYDSGDDFVDSQPKKSSSKNKSEKTPLTPKRAKSSTPSSSVSVAGKGKMAVEQQVAYTLKPISLTPTPSPDAPMLRAALTAKRDSQAVRGGTTGNKNSTKQQVRKRVAAKESIIVKIKKARVAETVTIAAEPGCSTAIPEAQPDLEIATPSQVSTQVSTLSCPNDKSDSESEFDILSQDEERNLLGRFQNLILHSVKEYNSKKDEFQAADNSVRVVELNMRGVDSDLQKIQEERRRLDEEEQRLLNRKNILTQSLQNSTAEREQKRGGMEKAKKKVEYFKNKVKKLFE